MAPCPHMDVAPLYRNWKRMTRSGRREEIQESLRTALAARQADATPGRPQSDTSRSDMHVYEYGIAESP